MKWNEMLMIGCFQNDNDPNKWEMSVCEGPALPFSQVHHRLRWGPMCTAPAPSTSSSPLCHNNTYMSFQCLIDIDIDKDFLDLFLEWKRGGREGEKYQCLVSSQTTPLGTWPTTWAYALTGNGTSNPLVCIWCSIHWATPARHPGTFNLIPSWILRFPWGISLSNKNSPGSQTDRETETLNSIPGSAPDPALSLPLSGLTVSALEWLW